MTRELGALGAHPAFQLLDPGFDKLFTQLQALVFRQSDQGAFQIEDDVDQAHGFAGQGRDGGDFILGSRGRGLGDIGEDKELSPSVTPTCRFCNRAWPSLPFIKLLISGIGVGLENALEISQVVGRVLSRPVWRVEEDGGGRGLTAEGAVVANIGP